MTAQLRSKAGRASVPLMALRWEQKDESHWVGLDPASGTEVAGVVLTPDLDAARTGELEFYWKGGRDDCGSRRLKDGRFGTAAEAKAAVEELGHVRWRWRLEQRLWPREPRAGG